MASPVSYLNRSLPAIGPRAWVFCQALGVFSVARFSAHLPKPGALVSASSGTGRGGAAQSGCLSTGSQRGGKFIAAISRHWQVAARPEGGQGGCVGVRVVATACAVAPASRSRGLWPPLLGVLAVRG